LAAPPFFFYFFFFLQSTLVDSNLGILRVDAAKISGLVVGQIVHGGLGQVEAVVGVVNGQDVDGLAVVGDAVASAALIRVPAWDADVAADVGEFGDGALGLPAVLGNEAIRAVGARDGRHGTAAIVVASVVANRDSGGKAGKTEDCARKLHRAGWTGGRGWLRRLGMRWERWRGKMPRRGCWMAGGMKWLW